MRDQLASDPGLLISYHANVAMLLCDRFSNSNFRHAPTRNRAALDILNLIFDLPTLPTEIRTAARWVDIPIGFFEIDLTV